MRIVCISDVHGREYELVIPKGDMLIVAGDLSLDGEPSEIDLFERFLERQPHRYKIVIAGNHDKVLEDDDIAFMLIRHAIYLRDRSISIEGIKFYGTPWVPYYPGFAFSKHTGDPLKRVWEKIPGDTDVLITHTPPWGILDLGPDFNHQGSPSLLRRVMDIRPKVHIFGHIHSGHGIEEKEGILFINASVLDEDYEPAYEPIVIDI